MRFSEVKRGVRIDWEDSFGGNDDRAMMTGSKPVGPCTGGWILKITRDSGTGMHQCLRGGGGGREMKGIEPFQQNVS